MCRFVIVVGLLLGQAAFAAGPPTVPASVRVYSDYCVSEGTGDVGGTRITLLRFYDGDYIAFQLAEGAFLIPSMAKAEIKSETGAIAFQIRDASYNLSFVGKLTPSLLSGRMQWHDNPDPLEEIRLERVHNNQEPVRKCGD